MVELRAARAALADPGARSVAPHLGSAFDRLRQEICSTVVYGSNVSAVVMGGPGSGKSTLVDQVIASVAKEHNSAADGVPCVGVVRLSGLLHGGDERAALRAISSQLCRNWGFRFSPSASFAENMAFLRSMLEELQRGHRSVVFVLDGFEAFLQRQKQTLVYNLLDVLHLSQAQAAIVGVTSRYDVVEMMEKRSRSRFSHRKVLLPSPSPAQALAMAEAVCTLPATFQGAPEGFREMFAAGVRTTFAAPHVRALLEREAHVDRSLHHVVGTARAALALLTPERPCLTPEHVEEALEQRRPRGRHAVIPTLSPLEVVLLVAMQRLEGCGKTPYNFCETFEEYLRATRDHPDQWQTLRFGFATALSAFENLLEMELAVPPDARQGQSLKDYKPVQLTVSRSDLHAAVQRNQGLPEVVKTWLDSN